MLDQIIFNIFHFMNSNFLVADFGPDLLEVDRHSDCRIAESFSETI